MVEKIEFEFFIENCPLNSKKRWNPAYGHVYWPHDKMCTNERQHFSMRMFELKSLKLTEENLLMCIDNLYDSNRIESIIQLKILSFEMNWKVAM